MGLLENTIVYEIGSIEDSKDHGVGWRERVTSFMEERKIKVLDPCHKQFIKDIKETGEANKELRAWRRDGEFDKVADKMREIRIYDLKMVDRADFLFCYLDKDIPTCGSWEEIFWGAGRLKKPVFFVYKQGKNEVPLWLFGTIPHKYFYNSIDEALEVIDKIDKGEIEMDSDRWKLFSPSFR